MQNRDKDLQTYYYAKLVKSLSHLEYSYNRVNKMPTDPSQMTEPEFEAWDGFTARFARSSDIFLSRYIKAGVKKDDPAFDGGFRDYLNRAEKLGFIDDTAPWIEIRELRNIAVHEYSDQDLKEIFEKLKAHAPLILALRSRLANASQS